MKKAIILRIIRVMARWALVSLGLFLMLLIGAFILAYFFSDGIIRYYGKQIAKAMHVKLDIHHSKLKGLTLVLEGITLQTVEGQMLARIERLEAPLHLYNGIFYGSSRWLDDINLFQPRIELALSRDGRFNWQSIKWPQPPTDTALQQAYRGQIQIQDGALVLIDQRQDQFISEINTLNALFTWKPQASWTLQAKTGDNKLQCTALADPQKPITAVVTLNQLKLDPFLRHPAISNNLFIADASSSGTINLQIPLHEPLATIILGQLDLQAQSLHVRGKNQLIRNLRTRCKLIANSIDILNANMQWQGQTIKLKGQVRPSFDNSPPWLHLNIKSGPIALNKLASFSPPMSSIKAGQGWIDIMINGTPDDPSLAGQFKAQNVVLAMPQQPEQTTNISELLADFELDRNSLHLKDLQAHTHSGEAIKGGGWLFLDSKHDLYLRLNGGASEARKISPLLAGIGDLNLIALGTLQQPVLAGQAEIKALPDNPLHLINGSANFWLDQQSAMLYGATFQGNDGQVNVPWALLDHQSGQFDAQANLSDYSIHNNGITAQIQALAQITGNAKTRQLEATAYLQQGQVRVPGLPLFENIHGLVGLHNDQVQIPYLQAHCGSDLLAVTGQLRGKQGQFSLTMPGFKADRYLAGFPSDLRSLNAEVELDGDKISGFRAVTRGANGEAYAVGRWLPQRSPELFAQFANLKVPNNNISLHGELATFWENNRLGYYYGLRPDRTSPENWLAGQGFMANNRLQMVENILHLPGSITPAVTAFQGEGRAYSYFGPIQGPPLLHHNYSVNNWSYGGILSFQGGLDLRDGRVYDLNLSGRSLNLNQFNNWFGPLAIPDWYRQLQIQLQEVLVDVDGHIEGPLSEPKLSASLRSPWTHLTRNQDGQLESTVFSWRTDASYHKGQLNLFSLISPHSMDTRLLTWRGPIQDGTAANDWLRSYVTAKKTGQWTGWLRTQAFPLAQSRWLVAPWIANKLPSGVLATDSQGIQIGGSFYQPQIAGRVDLKDGRFWTGFEYVPIDQAYLELASGFQAIAIPHLYLKSGGLTLEGRGSRTADGTLAGQLWADDLTLATLNQFGIDTHGWNGTVDTAMTFRSIPGDWPEAWLALQADNLHSRQNGVFGIRRLVLGQVDRNLDGIPFTTEGRGINLSLQDHKISLRLPPAGAEIEWDTPQSSKAIAHGQLTWSEFPQANQKPLDWLRSPQGPSFGQQGQPFQLEIRDFSWSLVKQLLALEPDQRVGAFTGNLELLGQYYQQHLAKKPLLTGKPLLAINLENLIIEGPGASWSGVQLASPLALTYQVANGAGWLNLEPVILEFFHRVIKSIPVKQDVSDPAMAQASPQAIQGKLHLDAAFVAMENPGAQKLASLNPNQHVKALLEDLDLQNLAFVFPNLSRLGGTIKRIEFFNHKPLAQADAQLTIAAQDVQIQGLNITSIQGTARLTAENPGQFNLFLGEGDNELQLLLGANQDLNQALRLQGKASLDFDRLLLPKSPVLISSASGWTLTDKSSFNLNAQLQDNQMRLLSAFIPDPQHSRLTGNLKASLQLQGTAANPELTGLFTVENGGFSHPDLSMPLTGFNMSARFEQIPSSQAEQTPALHQVEAYHLQHNLSSEIGRISLEQLEGTLGSQKFRSQGKIEGIGHHPTFMNFTFEGQDLPIHWNGLMDGQANIQLSLTGKPGSSPNNLTPFLFGHIEIPEANITVPDEEYITSLISLLRHHYKPKNLDYNVDLSLGNDVFGHYQGSNIRAQGDLKITPSLTNTQPVLNGVLLLSRGIIRIPLYGMNFRIRQGYAYFENDFIPRLDNLEADSTIGSYQITTRFDGKWPNIHADLYANPPLPESDIRSIIGMGALPGASPYSSNTMLVSNYLQNPNSGTFLLNQGVSLLSNLLTQELTQNLGRLLFASEVSLDILPSSEYALRVAKSLNDQDTVLLTFAQSIGITRFNGRLTQYGLEYRFQPNLLTRITLNNYGQAQLWFQGMVRF